MVAGRRTMSSSSATRQRLVAAETVVELQRPTEDAADRSRRVERGVGHLEHDLDAAQLVTRALGSAARQPCAVERTSPHAAGRSSATTRARVFLLDPDSPMTPSVVPILMMKPTSRSTSMQGLKVLVPTFLGS